MGNPTEKEAAEAEAQEVSVLSPSNPEAIVHRALTGGSGLL